MLTIKENTLERIKDWSTDSIHILADFDRTITTHLSTTSWSILEKSNLVSENYVTERQKLHKYYWQKEIDETLSFEEKNYYMNEWWTKHINLLVKYQISEEAINKAVEDSSVMTFRPGAKKLFKLCKNKNIPLIIISAGIGNFIEKFLINNNCYYDNIHIVSNFLKFENGIAIGMENNIIHSLNKNQIALTKDIKALIKNRPNIILFGDNTSDVKMAKDTSRENALKIGFLEEKVEENKKYYEDVFDIVCTNTDYNELLEILTILN